MREKEIIFLPGILTGQEEEMYIFLKNYFEKKSWVFSFFEYSSLEDIGTLTIKSVISDLEKYLSRKPDREVFFVGHSFGALILLYFLEDNIIFNKNKVLLFDPSVFPPAPEIIEDVFVKKREGVYLEMDGQRKISLELFKDMTKNNNEVFKFFAKEGLLTVWSDEVFKIRGKELANFLGDFEVVKKSDHMFSLESNLDDIEMLLNNFLK